MSIERSGTLVARHGLLAPGWSISSGVNHSGHSDSTGAVTGNILGLPHGEEALPENLLDQAEGREGREVTEQLADDFATGEVLDWMWCPPS